MGWKALRYLRWSDPWRALLRGGALFLAMAWFGLYLIGTAVHEFGQAWALSQDGVHTQGVVLRHFTSSTSGKGNRFWVEYQFEAARPYRGRASVSESQWVAYQPGRPIAVWYLPEDPDLHTLSPRSIWWGAIGYTLGGVTLLSVGAFGTLAVLAQMQQNATLRETGERGSAKVTRISGGGRTGWRAEWRDETGRTGTIQRVWRMNLPDEGATITLYADPTGRLPPVWDGDCGPR